MAKTRKFGGHKRTSGHKFDRHKRTSRHKQSRHKRTSRHKRLTRKTRRMQWRLKGGSFDCEKAYTKFIKNCPTYKAPETNEYAHLKERGTPHPYHLAAPGNPHTYEVVDFPSNPTYASIRSEENPYSTIPSLNYETIPSLYKRTSKYNPSKQNSAGWVLGPDKTWVPKTGNSPYAEIQHIPKAIADFKRLSKK